MYAQPAPRTAPARIADLSILPEGTMRGQFRSSTLLAVPAEGGFHLADAETGEFITRTSRRTIAMACKSIRLNDSGIIWVAA